MIRREVEAMNRTGFCLTMTMARNVGAEFASSSIIANILGARIVSRY
jgi:hypothetical protein